MNKTEALDLTASWLTISAAFAILISSTDFFNITGFVVAFPLSAIVVGTGFVFHELAHRQVARHFGAHAEYRAWPFGLVFALISAFIGFIFAAPGAVYIFDENIDKRKNGLISVAGPVTNIIISIFFLALSLVAINSWATLLGVMGFRINMFLALFNMIPFGPLDGKKVFEWNPIAWFAVIATAFIGVFFAPAIITSMF